MATRMRAYSLNVVATLMIAIIATDTVKASYWSTYSPPAGGEEGP